MTENDIKSNPDEYLSRKMAEFYADPLGFIMFAFPWNTDPSIQIVPLQSPWKERYPNCKYGPDAWACQQLDELGEEIKKRADGVIPMSPIRMADASGHGIGKTAYVGMINSFIMSTRPYSRGVVTANTAPQLESKTWAEIAKWARKSVTSHWWKITTGRGSMRMAHIDYPESWRVDAQTCAEENSEAFAGLHAANSTPFYIFDEASAIPEKIWEVSEGGMTDGEPMWFVFGNPTRNTGKFRECFGRQKHRWITRQIDSREAFITNKQQIQEWIDDYGEDSDFVRVRAKGQFPRASTSQFIGQDLVDAAVSVNWGLDTSPYSWAPVIMGVDVARFGDDQSVILVRQGLMVHEITAFREMDTMKLADQVAGKIKEWRPKSVFVDAIGIGAGVCDRLRQLQFLNIVDVISGEKAGEVKYNNKRSEMWGNMKDWLKAGGNIPDDAELKADLVAPEYFYTPSHKIQLERKKDMKARGLQSPDKGDSLAFTFAYPVMTDEKTEQRTPEQEDWLKITGQAEAGMAINLED